MSHIWPTWKNLPILGRYTQGRIQASTSKAGTIPRQRTLVDPRLGKHQVDSQVIVQDTSISQVKSSIIQARQAQTSWASLPGTARRDGMLAFAQEVATHKGLLAQLGSLETGKPYADSVGEVDEVIECLRHFAGYADKPRGVSMAEQQQLGMHFTTQPEPIGVCGLITSYNYPIMLTGWKLSPALATGNSVIIKPAPQTPLTTLALAELSHHVLPTDVIQVLPGGLETGQAIVDLVDKISFTGSTPAGQALMRQAADRLQPLTLECGGKNTVIIDADADLAVAAYHVSQGAFSNTGQNCCAVSRVLVHSHVHDAFVALLETETRRWKPVLPVLSDHDEKDDGGASYYYGPLIDQQQFDRVQRYLTHPTLQPAFTALPQTGQSFGYYIPPTVYVGVDEDDSLAQDEIFGPVLSILAPFDTIDEAVTRANTATPFGLAAGVFSEKYATAHYIASQLKTGIVWINTYNSIPASVPFGGRKLSGFGKDLGRNALDEFSFTKSILHAL